MACERGRANGHRQCVACRDEGVTFRISLIPAQARSGALEQPLARAQGDPVEPLGRQAGPDRLGPPA